MRRAPRGEPHSPTRGAPDARRDGADDRDRARVARARRDDARRRDDETRGGPTRATHRRRRIESARRKRDARDARRVNGDASDESARANAKPSDGGGRGRAAGDGDGEERGMERAGDVAEPGSGVELHNAELARGTSGDQARAREPWE